MSREKVGQQQGQGVMEKGLAATDDHDDCDTDNHDRADEDVHDDADDTENDDRDGDDEQICRMNTGT